MTYIRQAGVNDAKKIATIARPIWREHYTPIIGPEQVEYMLDKFQSESAIIEQIAKGYQYFLIQHEQENAGYMACEIRSKSLFISKFYLSSDFRGLGIARVMLDEVIALANANTCDQLELTVNKDNPAYGVYLKLGFENRESIKIDIGQGYIMDDYRMVKLL